MVGSARSKSSLVTASELKTRTVTIDVPHGELLVRAAAALGSWQEEAERLKAEMAKLEETGIFLDDNGDPVVPGWWERKESGHHIAWYLVWPAKYARRAKRKRRQYVKAADYEKTKAQAQRTLEYASLKLKHDRLTQQVEQLGQDLPIYLI